MLTREGVQKVAHLARLSFTDEEIEEQHSQLSMIIEVMDCLREIDTTGVEPLNHVIDVHNVWRDDVAEKSMAVNEVLKNAPDESDHMFQVPRIV